MSSLITAAMKSWSDNCVYHDVKSGRFWTAYGICILNRGAYAIQVLRGARSSGSYVSGGNLAAIV